MAGEVVSQPDHRVDLAGKPGVTFLCQASSPPAGVVAAPTRLLYNRTDRAGSPFQRPPVTNAFFCHPVLPCHGQRVPGNDKTRPFAVALDAINGCSVSQGIAGD